MEFTMTNIPLSRVDLNLLVVLDVLLRERSVSKAADQLNLTASAVSHALKRLRTLLDNELLVREGRIMVPTARGRELEEALPSLMSHIERTLVPAEVFDPETSTRTFRLVAPDFIMPSILGLLEKIGGDAPGISVELVSVTPAAIAEMKQGQCDGLIAPSGVRDEGMRERPIGRWPWAVFGRKGHPAFKDWSRSGWANYPHLKVRTAGPEGKGPVDQIAANIGLERKIGAIVPHFSFAASAIAQTDMLLTVPTIALASAAKIHELDQREVPFEMPPLRLSLFNNVRTGDDPDIRWFLERVLSTLAELSENT
jgi:DNA-binding transcriptional LysR family regulator